MRWILGIAFFIFVVVSTWLLFFQFDPSSETITYQRLSQIKEQLVVEFSTPCRPTGSHYFLTGGERKGQAVSIHWPVDLLDPADLEYGVPGNQFTLSGFWVEKKVNDKTLLQFFDVVGWKIITPYSVWNSDSTLNEGLNAPVKFDIQASEPSVTLSGTIDTGC